MEHLSEVEYADTCAGFAANCMFWIDLLVLTFARASERDLSLPGDRDSPKLLLPSVLQQSTWQCIGLKTGDACECSEALFYLDIVLDIKQLVLFGNSELYGYLALNLAGMALPPVFTTLEAIRFGERGSPEKDRLERLLSPTLLLPAVLAAIITPNLDGSLGGAVGFGSQDSRGLAGLFRSSGAAIAGRSL